MTAKKRTPSGFLLAFFLAAAAVWAPSASASEPFVGEIRMFAGNFAPRAWSYCDGQLLAVSGNDALFSLLGTTYGGDGRTTFGLPDLRGRFAMHQGSGPGLTLRRIGQSGGSERVTLAASQVPSHSHGVAVELRAQSGQGNQSGPEGNVWAYDRRDTQYSDQPPDVAMAAPEVTVDPHVGGGQSHENMPPFQAIHHIIALSGIYPSRH